MKKYLSKLILLIIAFLVVTGIEILYKHDRLEVETVTVYVASERIKSGTYIMDYMLESIELPKHLASEYIVKEPIRGYLLDSIDEGQFIYEHQVSKSAPLEMQDNQRMITIKCDTVTANGWLFQINEMIDVIMIRADQMICLEDAIICRIFDETLDDNQPPEYVSLIVDKNAAETYFKNIEKAEVYLSKKHK